jgi:hypothetical protein
VTGKQVKLTLIVTLYPKNQNTNKSKAPQKIYTHRIYSWIEAVDLEMQEVHPSRGDLATFHTVFLDISMKEYYQHDAYHVYALGGYLIITQ